MFKALLVIYVVSVGSEGNRGGSLTTTPFETMEQCKAAITHAQTVTDKWHYGDDKTNIVPVKRTMQCFEIPAGPVTPAADSNTGNVPTPACEPSDLPERLHKRWDQP